MTADTHALIEDIAACQAIHSNFRKIWCNAKLLPRRRPFKTRNHIWGPLVEKSDLVTAIANQSDLSLVEAASAVEFVLLAMRFEKASFKAILPGNKDPGAYGANLPLLQRLQADTDH